MQIKDITELLKQAYMEEQWDSVLECINLLNDYEERTSSTHALTMYRHNCNHKGTDYKVGK